MTEKKLSTGRKVLIKDLTEDQIADLEDIPEIYFINEQEKNNFIIDEVDKRLNQMG